MSVFEKITLAYYVIDVALCVTIYVLNVRRNAKI